MCLDSHFMQVVVIFSCRFDSTLYVVVCYQYTRSSRKINSVQEQAGVSLLEIAT